MRVLVLGAGFGGLELTTQLSDELGDDVEVVLIDKGEGFVFGFSKLDVMFGRTVADAVVHPYRDLVKPGVRFVQTTILSDTFGDAIDIVLVDKSDAFVFGFSKLDVMFGRVIPATRLPGCPRPA